MKTKVQAANAPQSPNLLSQAIMTDNLVFVSGQIHMTLDGTMIEGSIEERLSQVMTNIQAILTAAGLSLNNIVKVTVYLTDMTELKKLNEAYPKYFQDTLPAREAVCVKELPLGASLEISVVATK